MRTYCPTTVRRFTSFLPSGRQYVLPGIQLVCSSLPQSAALRPGTQSAACPMRPILAPAPAAPSDCSRSVWRRRRRTVALCLKCKVLTESAGKRSEFRSPTVFSASFTPPTRLIKHNTTSQRLPVGRVARVQPNKFLGWFKMRRRGEMLGKGSHHAPFRFSPNRNPGYGVHNLCTLF